jgi:hypothetical protein
MQLVSQEFALFDNQKYNMEHVLESILNVATFSDTSIH